MPKFYATLCQSHSHILPDGTRWGKDGILRIVCLEKDGAINYLHDKFGDNWGEIYASKIGLLGFFPDGIIATVYIGYGADSNDLLEAISDISLELGHWAFAHFDREGREEYGELATNDSRALTEVSIHWAKEFIELHKGRIWDGEYTEELQNFLKSKNIFGLCQ